MKVMLVSRNNAAETALQLRTRAAGDSEIKEIVREIVEDVRKEGDEALIRLASQIDRVDLSLEELLTEREEMKESLQHLPPDLILALKTLRRNILAFERRIFKRLSISLNINGYAVNFRPIPLESVGCYAPGGLASYPSTIMMLGVPGSLAGVERLVLATPPRRNEADKRLVMAAAYLAGFHQILWAGGAQAIAALAYGTQRLRRVMKILGPGNRFVLEAKLLVSKEVTVDFTAGPTELLVVTDSHSPHGQAALELLAQAEHSPDTLVGAITLDAESGEQLLSKLNELLEKLPEGSAAKKSIADNGFICAADSWEAAARFINTLAPEHILVYARVGWRNLRMIRNAGVVSYGPASSSVFLDYYAGPSHVLPTEGMASIRGGLTVLDYVKLLPVVKPTKPSLAKALKNMRPLILAEGLPLHLRALEGALGHDAK